MPFDPERRPLRGTAEPAATVLDRQGQARPSRLSGKTIRTSPTDRRSRGVFSRPMPLLSFDRVSISFGLQPLLEQASFQIDSAERVCLIGRNGAGKSTLLRIVAGEVVADAGEVARTPGLRIARLAQEPSFDEEASVFDVVAQGLAEIGRLLAEFHRVSHALSTDPAKLRRMEDLQHQIDACDGWRLSQRVDHILAKLELPPDARIGTLSGGWRRRVALAQALVCEPDLLLLDEPTNHLDIELIQWLEEQLLEFRGGVLFVTHDRALLARLATRILELDRGALVSWAGDYTKYSKFITAAQEFFKQSFDEPVSKSETRRFVT